MRVFPQSASQFCDGTARASLQLSLNLSHMGQLEKDLEAVVTFVFVVRDLPKSNRAV